jgi:hypothetical protein
MKTEFRMQDAETRMLNPASSLPPPASRFPFHVSRFTHHASRFTRPSPLAPRPSERGVALVITLVLLSVITFMAVTFLVVSRSQHGSVVTETEQAIARLAADTARERAIAQLLAPIMAWTNEFNYGLLVSTNYISPTGFTNGVSSPLNVNYDLNSQARLPLTAAERAQNIANLLYDPRPPVYIVTNAWGSNDFRFYLDLNRNGRPDPSGFQPEIANDPQGRPGFFGTDGSFISYQWPPPSNIRSNFFVGDPEWIGALRYPEFAHAADNPFVYRYAYLVVPAGQTLDLNNIHNDAKRLDFNKSQDGFLRNQGVLTAEINLAAFLADLNTNFWPTYQYIPFTPTENPSQLSNRGLAFEDASALLLYRYSSNFNSIASIKTLLPVGANAFGQDYIDGYSAGPVMLGTLWPGGGLADLDRSRTNLSWSGADNPNHFYTTQDLLDQRKTRPPSAAPKVPYFTDRLLMAGTNINTYDRYTFYRLLSQLGTDSAPEPSGKMNLNYRNVDNNGYVVPNMVTNFIPWTPIQFFTNAAIRLLADAGYTVGPYYSTSNLLVLSSISNLVNGSYVFTTNLHIPLWPTNFYTPSVHRYFQLAANIYDATTNQSPVYPYLPSVFRPVFANTGGTKTSSQVSIIDFEEVTNARVLSASAFMVDLSDPNSRASLKAVDNQRMVYNIPLVIGAKKGFPNFNEFAMQTQVEVTRKLQFTRQNGPNTPISHTNQMFLVGISNVLAVEAWNSYVTNFSRALRLYYMPDISVVMTNETGAALNPYQRYQPPMRWTEISSNAWPGYNRTYETYSFQVPLSTNLMFLTNSTYLHAARRFVPAFGTFEQLSPAFYIPHWWINVKARLRFAIVDVGTSRIVDYVNLADQTLVNLTDTLMQGGQCGSSYSPDGSYGSMWCTNHYPSLTDESLPTFGVLNQIQVSMAQQPAYGQAVWNSAMNSFAGGMDKPAAIDSFRNQFGLGPMFSHPAGTVFYPSNTFAAPFQPVRNIFFVTTWQANDPLVHYTVGDLTSLTRTNLVLDTPPTPALMANVGRVNARYEPWGGNPSTGSSSPTKFDLRFKDPLMLQSDSWDFPTNKFPNVGWLGRVHRGTPWQTIYLKSPALDLPTWQRWTGNGLLLTNAGQTAVFATNSLFPDAFLTQPTNDWRIVDLFTSALNDNATRGQLSINQPNLAAWSAVLSGVIVLTNNLNASGNPIVDAHGNPIPRGVPIQPAGVFDLSNPATWPPLVQLVKRINDVRATNNTHHIFSRLGDLLAVPEFTVSSPFLNTNGTATLPNSGLNDAAYERLPQQVLGLLKCDHTPRFVIYAFGQTLKPALHALVPSGQYSGLCTNYQIMAEAATRTVVRLEGVQPSLPGTLPPPITTLHPVIESFNVLPPD